MPRYIVERSFYDGLHTSVDVIDRNADEGVTWLHSYVSDGRKTSFCIYEAPTPEAIRKAASRNGLLVERITEVRVLDPYPYRAADAFEEVT